MQIWHKQFNASYIREDGLVVLNDKDIPLPEGFVNDTQFRSNIIFPVNARGGDHIHTIREEVFVGFGEGMQLLVEDPQTHQVELFHMDPSHNQGQCTVYWMQVGIPHAVRNIGPTNGFLIEFASHPQESTKHIVRYEK